MQNLGKILLVNLGVLLAYSILIFFGSKSGSSNDPYAGMGFGFGMILAIALQMLVNLILMIVKFVKNQREIGLSYLVAFFVVAVVGFSSCLGGSALF
ncbi:MAG: hypothetical protein R2824_21220 [Saprospiraceae bacterium]